MRAMILAAGRGERLRPLTDRMPKPLIRLGGKPLIEYHLEALAAAGFREIVINQGHLGEMLPAALGDGTRWGVNIHWSLEKPEPLETGGGIYQALPQLGDGPFLVVNGDIFCAFPFARLRAVKCDHAHLVMVPNPPHNPAGDFALRNAIVSEDGPEKLTFAGIAVYHPRLLDGCAAGKYSMVPILKRAMRDCIVTGECYDGPWNDIGTRERLEQAEAGL